MSSESDTIELKGLDGLIKALKTKPPVARVGVLGGGAARKPKEGSSGGSTNAEILAAHEYGAPARGLPARSVLRVPLADKLTETLLSSGALGKEEAKQVVKTGSIMPWMRKVAAVAEEIVRGGFDTAGYGKWKGWKDPNYMNNAGMVLVDTTQLRDSITSDVKE